MVKLDLWMPTFYNCREVAITELEIDGVPLNNIWCELCRALANLDTVDDNDNSRMTVTWLNFEAACETIQKMKLLTETEKWDFDRVVKIQAPKNTKVFMALSMDELERSFEEVRMRKTAEYNHLNTIFEQLINNIIKERKRMDLEIEHMNLMLEDTKNLYWATFKSLTEKIKSQIKADRDKKIFDRNRLLEILENIKQQERHGLQTLSSYCSFAKEFDELIDGVTGCPERTYQNGQGEPEQGIQAI